MNKLIVYNKITNYINERFDEMTLDEIADLQAGDGTMSILDGIIKEYEEQGYMFNCHEIEMFADYISEKTSEYYEFYDLMTDDMPECTRLAERVAERLSKN